MKYYTLQLRSVDEGSTVFYTCEQCGHKYVPMSISAWIWKTNGYPTAGRILTTELESKAFVILL